MAVAAFDLAVAAVHEKLGPLVSSHLPGARDGRRLVVERLGRPSRPFALDGPSARVGHDMLISLGTHGLLLWRRNCRIHLCGAPRKTRTSGEMSGFWASSAWHK